MRDNSVVPPGFESLLPLSPALKRWAKLDRPSGARFLLASASAALVTLVAINAVVDITAHALMVLIGGRLGVAIRALEDCVVAWIGVARRTDSVRAPVVGAEPGVVERRACPPGHHLMAGLAGGWEPCRYVVGIVRCLVLGFVTRVAIAWN